MSVLEDLTKLCLAGVVEAAVSGARIAREVTVPIREGKIAFIVINHSTELTSNAKLSWTTQTGVDQNFIAPIVSMQSRIGEALSVEWRTNY